MAIKFERIQNAWWLELCAGYGVKPNCAEVKNQRADLGILIAIKLFEVHDEASNCYS